MKYRKEVLDRINKLNFDCSVFDHQLEDSNRTSASYKVSVESSNYDITIEIIENVIWTDYDDYYIDSLEIGHFEVLDLDCIDYANEFTDDEIIDNLNY